MTNSPSLRIGRLRAPASAQAEITARLAVEALVAEMPVVPVGASPQSVWFIPRLSMTLPAFALARVPNTALRQRFGVEVSAALRTCTQSAVRPARGEVAPPGVAVVFADEAELLACLARDAFQGNLQRWWWRALLGQSYPDWPVAFVNHPNAISGAFRWLAKWGLSEFASRALVQRINLPPAAAGSADTTYPAALARNRELSRESEQGLTKADSPQRSAPEASVEAPSIQPIRRETAPQGATMPSVKGDTRSYPTAHQSIGRSQLDVAAQLRLEVTASQGLSASDSVVVAPGGSLAGAVGEDAPQSVQILPVYPNHAPRPMNPDVMRDPSRRAVVRMQTELAPLNVSLAPTLPPHDPNAFPSIAELVDRACGIPSRPNSRHLAYSPELPLAVHPEPANQSEQVLEWQPAELEAESLFAQPGRIATGYGGLFFLVNVFLAQELYPDFTRPRDPGFPIPMWRLLAAVARRLVGPRLRRDPVWALLLALEDAPVREEAARLDELWAPPERSVRSQTQQQIDPVSDWLQGFVHWLRPELSQALGWPLGQVARRLLSEDATLWVSEGEVVVVMQLEQHPVEVRLAGLDRDPGFLPSAGRSLRFVFE